MSHSNHKDHHKDSKDEETENGENKKALLLKSVIKQVRAGVPFYKCQLPICFSESRSLLEKLSDFFLTSNMVINITQKKEAEERFLLICAFFLSSWHKGPKVVKAPFNPILGETFRCSFQHGDCSSDFISEQISHHPPSTAFCVYNRAKRLLLQAYLKPNTKFCGNSIETTIQGTLLGMLLDFEEFYEITYPKYITKGVLIGNLKLELGGKSSIICRKSGLSAEFEFKSKNSISGKIYRIDGEGKVNETVYSVFGNWDEKISYVHQKTKRESLLVNISEINEAQRVVPAFDLQHPNESQKVWHSVTENIGANQEEKALACKVAIEEEQRSLRKKKNQLQDWEPKHFVRIGETYVHPDLKNIFGIDLRALEPLFEGDIKKRKLFSNGNGNGNGNGNIFATNSPNLSQ